MDGQILNLMMALVWANQLINLTTCRQHRSEAVRYHIPQSGHSSGSEHCIYENLQHSGWQLWNCRHHSQTCQSCQGSLCEHSAKFNVWPSVRFLLWLTLMCSNRDVEELALWSHREHLCSSGLGGGRFNFFTWLWHAIMCSLNFTTFL